MRQPIALHLKDNLDHMEGGDRADTDAAEPTNASHNPTRPAPPRLGPPGYRGVNLIVAMPAAMFNPCWT